MAIVVDELRLSCNAAAVVVAADAEAIIDADAPEAFLYDLTVAADEAAGAGVVNSAEVGQQLTTMSTWELDEPEGSSSYLGRNREHMQISEKFAY
jgi:hypothetical protein